MRILLDKGRNAARNIITFNNKERKRKKKVRTKENLEFSLVYFANKYFKLAVLFVRVFLSISHANSEHFV